MSESPLAESTYQLFRGTNEKSRGKRNLFVGGLLVVFAVLGISISIWGGQQVKSEAREQWLADGQADASRMTEIVLLWVSQAELRLRSIALRFSDRGSLDENAFIELFESSTSWGQEAPFATAAFAERIMKAQRKDYEDASGRPLTTVSDSSLTAPLVHESFAVRLTTDRLGLLRASADLSTHEAMSTVASTAVRTPGKVILGPAFEGKGGRQFALIGMAAQAGETSGVMVASIDLTSFFESISTDYLLPGMQLRLIERDNEARAESVYKAIIGTIKPSIESAETQTIRITTGQARWELHWDILPTYLGGPAVRFAEAIQFGGVFVTVFIGAIIGFLLFQNIRFHRLVDERTAELSMKSTIIQLTMDTIDQGFVVWSADQRLVVWSQRCVDFWYGPVKGLKAGMHMSKLLSHIAERGVFGDGDQDQIVAQELDRITNAGKTADETFEMLDGRHVHVRRFPLEMGGYVAVYTDISDRTRFEHELVESRETLAVKVEERTQELRESEQSYRALFENAAAGIGRIRLADGKVIRANKKLAEIFGFETQDSFMSEFTIPELFAINGDHTQLIADFEGDPNQQHERSLIKRDGSNITLQIHGQVDHQAGHVNFVLVDITEGKRAEAQLIQSAKLASLGEMASSIVHELTQPLNVIGMSAQSLLLDIEDGELDSEACADSLNQISAQVTRMGETIDHMLMFSRRDKGEGRLFAPAASIGKALALVRRDIANADILLEVDVAENRGKVWGSHNQLQQVIVNLLTNARDAISENTTRMANEDGEYVGKIHIRLDANNESNLLKISVTDNGGGIPDDVRPRIFDPFYTTKEEGVGTGLGLSISYKIIESMKGRIEAFDTDGGSRFEIALPISIDE